MKYNCIVSIFKKQKICRDTNFVCDSNFEPH